MPALLDGLRHRALQRYNITSQRCRRRGRVVASCNCIVRSASLMRAFQLLLPNLTRNSKAIERSPCSSTGKQGSKMSQIRCSRQQLNLQDSEEANAKLCCRIGRTRHLFQILLWGSWTVQVMDVSAYSSPRCVSGRGSQARRKAPPQHTSRTCARCIGPCVRCAPAQPYHCRTRTAQQEHPAYANFQSAGLLRDDEKPSEAAVGCCR